jgi:hypothetical protein
MRREIIRIIDINHLEIDLQTNFNTVAFGISIGSNSFTGRRPDNLFIEIEFLFWCLGIEIKRFCN